jgi:shikimate 5-dehydrogenase
MSMKLLYPRFKSPCFACLNHDQISSAFLVSYTNDIILQQALKSYAVVFDAVYTPKETRLLREAAECGATVVSGLEMFIRQAMGQFEHFTGMPGKKKLLLFLYPCT